MIFLVDLAQSFLVNMRVNLGCGDVDVSEHFLDASQVGSAGQEVRCKAMSKRMNGQVPGHTCTDCIFLDNSPDFNTT